MTVRQRCIEIDAELEQLRQRRKKLLEERRNLAGTPLKADSPYWVYRALSIIKNRPGMARREIFVEMNDRNLTFKQLSNTLTTLRRRGYIENRGTRKHPRWYPTEEAVLKFPQT